MGKTKRKIKKKKSNLENNHTKRRYEQGVVTYPHDGMVKANVDRPKCSSPREKTRGVATNIYSRKTLEKPKRRSANFENKGSRVVYAWGRY